MQNEIPEEVLLNKSSNLKYIIVFERKAYYKEFTNDEMKLKHNAIKSDFLGFSLESYCFILIDYKNSSIHLDREVVFLTNSH
jgi:hypothetical protein